MKYLKKYGKRFLWTTISIIISITILTTLYYFNIINPTVYNYLKVFILLLNIFISSYILGKQTERYGYLEGMKFAAIMIIFFLIITLLTNVDIKLRLLLYYLIISITSIFGSMVGISKKDKNSK